MTTSSSAGTTRQQLPDPSTWVPLKSKFIDRSSSHWTSIYKAQLDPHQHSELCGRLANFVPASPTRKPDQDNANWIAIKIVSPHLNRPPHDTLTEIKTLSRLDHPNVAPLLAYREPPEHVNYCLFLPLYPLSLYELLNAQKKHFHPSTYAGFDVLTRRVVRDVGAGLSFLHNQSLAHRDINPSNIALTNQGHAVLIDFGTVWPGHPAPESDSLEFELGTMPYRAPELLFGSRSYSPLALDIWAFGALIAEFYRPMERSEDEFVPLDSAPSTPDNTGLGTGTAMDWYSSGDLSDPSGAALPQQANLICPVVRKTLFDGSIGDIGLAGSIFKIRGTPDSTTWPEAKRLPDFSKLNFHAFPKQDLRVHLPTLRYTLDSLVEKLSAIVGQDTEEAVKLRYQIEVERREMEEKVSMVDGFLSYESSARLRAFRDIFSPEPSCSSHDRCNSWIWETVVNEDQICVDTVDTFFLSESDC
ncbi:hypothetical protein PTTG_04799 [Puccinia triticina 1-1 BBBD Race 1]|uniref:cyclin-dependent kinase n=2 Tax=Puccinia triticina TaxID=208348 RepID=A0A180GFA2_PUCT1|nr:uncharacterized protein PtA15_4A565 [Puccinia triticina]OAV91012.1 hypothetical protein PTTG_04799 [Puccinia triticina 1-1 BBBD Race 1]WAQ84114.1 hypothetical protein PtA15_4A565 [Puccinia triticina]WAR54944.1 hypothetical protein PtB15_4B562 [Puccinia triticina]